MLTVRLYAPLLLSIVVLGFGCAGTTTELRGYPLYTSGAATRLPGNQVAQLSASMPGGASLGAGSSSFIKSVDGRELAELDATTYELLPGCHIVQTDRNLTLANESIRWSGELGSRIFPFRMKAGYEYVVVVELAEGMSGSGRISISAVERDMSGVQTQVIPAARSPDEVQACRAWKPAGS